MTLLLMHKLCVEVILQGIWFTSSSLYEITHYLIYFITLIIYQVRQ